MARRSASASEWERWQRMQAREAERQRRAAEAAARAAERRRRLEYIERRKAEAEERTRKVQERVRQLRTVLKRGLDRPARIDLATLRRTPSRPAFDPGQLAVPLPRPAWEDYAPSPLGFFAAFFGGRGRYERKVAAAQVTYRQAIEDWERAENERQRKLADAHGKHEEFLAKSKREADAFNLQLDRMAEGVRRRIKGDVEKYLDLVLQRVPLPSDFPRRAEVVFGASEHAVVRLQLPDRDAVPTARGYRYVQSRDEIQPVPRPAKETADLYRSLVAQVALLVVRDVFDADPALKTVTFNGHVDTTNPGTGKREYPCLISLNVERAAFAELVLDQVRPEVCLRHLNALVSPHPYELEPIEPILDFDLTKFSFVQGMDAVSSLDSRPDLMQMRPTEFEHLVRQLFEAMGLQGWTTSPSKDDGVDAVVTNPTPIVGGLTIVQAKRYSTVVGVNHIRELAGAMEEKKAGHGILVTTSWFTAGGWQKAREHGRIELIDGPRLVYLIKKHLGKDVLIGIKRPPTANNGPAPPTAVS